MPQGLSVDIKDISASGIELVEEMMGYDRAIVIDAIATGGRVGAIRRLTPEQLIHTVHFTAPHAFNFPSAYELAKRFGSSSMPKKVEIYGVEIVPTTDFSEGLSFEVSEAAERLAKEIIEGLVRDEAKQHVQ